jgi:hypothetical protein
MKKVIHSKFRIFIALLAVLISACNTNATFSKRYHSRGFHIAWNSGTTNKIGTNNKADTKKITKKSQLAIPTESSRKGVVEIPVSVKNSSAPVYRPITNQTVCDVNSTILQNTNPIVIDLNSPNNQTADLFKTDTQDIEKASKPRTSANIFKNFNSELNKLNGPILGKLSFYLGAAAWLALFTRLYMLAFPFLIGAIVLGILGLNYKNKGWAIAGLTLGLLLAVYALVVTLYVLAILSFFW